MVFSGANCQIAGVTGVMIPVNPAESLVAVGLMNLTLLLCGRHESESTKRVVSDSRFMILAGIMQHPGRDSQQQKEEASQVT